ncbi:MAG: tetratricopeptide repeat protein [Terrimicrobiaceae bacterium]
MHFPRKWFGRLAGVAVLTTGAWGILWNFQTRASQADWMRPEEFSYPESLQLRPDAEKTAEAHARFLEALFLEEEFGPDAALKSKQSVLRFDPGFTELAVDVAQHHLHRGETPQAISILKDAKKASPRDPALSLALASVYLRHLQKPLLAEKHGLDALEIDPVCKPAYELLWEIHRASGQTQKIEPLFQRAERRRSEDLDFLVMIADLRLREIARSRHAPAPETDAKISALLDRIENLAAAKPETLARTGDFHVLSGHLQRGVDLYEKALALNPALVGIREKLAQALVQLGRNERAAELLAQIVADNPVNLPAYDQLAKVHLLRGEFDRAAAAMRQALLLAPIDPRRHEDIIRTSLRAGDHAGALQAAAEAEAKFPYISGFTILRAITLSQAGDHAAAMMAFERALVTAANSNPELLDSEFYLSYGGAAERAGHHVKAAELLKKSIALDPPRSAQACNYLGYMWADRGENLPEAEQLIRRALELEPGNGAFRDSLGWVLFRQGHFNEALTELLRASESMPEPDPVVFDHIGDVYGKLGKTSDALLFWRKALQLDPKNPLITEKLDSHAARMASQPESN